MGRPTRWLVATSVLGALAVGTAGAWLYVAQRQYLHQTASANLLAIAQAKLDQIGAWRAERLGDAAVLRESPFFGPAVARWLAGRRPPIAADILTRLSSSKAYYGYDDVRLVDRAGRVVMATSGRSATLDSGDAAALGAAFRERRPAMGDVHASAADSIPHLVVVAPLFASSARDAEPLAAVVYVVDPRLALFRVVAVSPSPRRSVAAMLVRRDGDSALFLTAPRSQAGVAPLRRVALSRRSDPAVMAVLGAEGIVRGVDHRGVKVIAALRAVPETAWLLVVKEDEAEALAVWRTPAALVFGFLLALVLVAAATAVALGQRSATARFKRLYEAEAALRASEARFRALVEEAGDGFAILDAEGRYLDVNSECCLQLGYARADLLRLSISDVDSLFTPQQFAADFQSLVGKRPASYESVHRRKDGTTFPVEVTLSVAQIGDVPRALLLARDITERKRAVEALVESKERFRLAVLAAFNAVWDWNLRTDAVWWSESFQTLFGYREEEIEPGVESWRNRIHPDDRDRVTSVIQAAIDSGRQGWSDRYRFRRGDGSYAVVDDRGYVVRAGNGDPVRMIGAMQDISESARAEEALRRSETLLNTTQELAKVGGWEFDVARQRMTWTAQLYRLHDLPEGGIAPGSMEHIDRSLECYSPEDRPTILRAFERCAQWGEPYDLEFPFTTFAGRRIWIRTCARAERENGKIVRVVGDLADITERKQAEEVLARTSAELHSVMDAVAEGVLVVDRTGRVLLANARFREMWRIPDEVAASREDGVLLDFVVDQLVDPEGFLAKVRALYGQDVESWDTLAFKDGRVFERFSRPLVEGGLAMARLWAFRDVTERRVAEAALRESEERHRSIIEQLTDAYYRTDRDGIITMMSPSAAQVLGLPSISMMIGRPIESFWQDPSQRAALLAAIAEDGFVRDFEATAVRTDGTAVAVAVTSHFVRDGSGAVAGVEGIIRDITERKRAEAALRALAVHLDSVREEEHTRIARQVHDDLGQALTALRLDLTWVGRKLPKGNTALRRRIDAAVGLTDEMIAVGQHIVADLRPPILDDLGLVPAVEWYAQHFAKRSGLRIEFDVGAEEPAVPDRLAVAAYRIVQEALTNVARHAQATQVRVRLGEQDGTLTIEIRDDGQGFPEEAIRSPRSFGIVGMRERAASQGGVLLVTSSPSAGTTVRVTFPLDRPTVREEPR